jgi:hypothetical protein
MDCEVITEVSWGALAGGGSVIMGRGLITEFWLGRACRDGCAIMFGPYHGRSRMRMVGSDVVGGG